MIMDTTLENQNSWVILSPPKTISVFLSANPSPAPEHGLLGKGSRSSHTPIPIDSVPAWSAVLRKIHCSSSVIIRDGCQGHEIKD